MLYLPEFRPLFKSEISVFPSTSTYLAIKMMKFTIKIIFFFLMDLSQSGHFQENEDFGREEHRTLMEHKQKEKGALAK